MKLNILLFTFFIPLHLRADSLTQIELYYRCYSQLTNSRPQSSDPNLEKIRTGSISAISACGELIDNTTLQNDGTISDPTQLKVLRTLHNFHSTWLSKRNWEYGAVYTASTGMQDVYEGSDDAFYFTKALFARGAKYSDVLTKNELPLPLRTEQNPRVSNNSNVSLDALKFSDNFSFAPTGDLLGVNTKITAITHPLQGTNSLPLHTNLGGGLLGSLRYILNNIGFSEYDASALSYSPAYDGALKMPRLWGRALFSDLLCRSIPVIDPEDAEPFVIASADAPFRKTSGCSSCHASIDRVSSLLRNIKILAVQDAITLSFVALRSVTEEKETSWQAKADPLYTSRPATGTFYFRDYKGDLKNIEVPGLVQLGEVLADLDDFYICAASRYYQYFMGIEVPVNVRMGSDTTNPKLSLIQQKVISLGLNLKNTQSLKALLKEIINMPEYGLSDYGVAN